MLLLLASSPDCTYPANWNTELTKTFKMVDTDQWVLNCSHGGTAQHHRLLWSLSGSNCTFTVFLICQTNEVQAAIVWALLLRLLSPTYHGLCSLYISLPTPEALRIPLSRIHGLGVAPSSATFLLPGCSWLSLELRFCSEHSCCFWLLLPDRFLPVNFKFESLGGQSLFHTQLFIAGFWVGPESHGFMTSIAWHYINQNCIVEALLLGDLYGCANDPRGLLFL